MDKTNPDHYFLLDPEPIEVMKAWLTDEEFRGYCKGTVIKYLSRMGRKQGESDLDDSLKAAWFLDRLIEEQKNG